MQHQISSVRPAPRGTMPAEEGPVNLLGGGKSLHATEGAIANGVRVHRTHVITTAATEDQVRRTVILVGVKFLLGPTFGGDDYRDAILPHDVARWCAEQCGATVLKVHLRPPVQAWVEFDTEEGAANALAMSGATFPFKSRHAPGGRLKINPGTHGEMIKGARDHLNTPSWATLIPERLRGRETDAGERSAASVVDAARFANPFYDEDVAAYERYHRRLAEAYVANATAGNRAEEARKKLFRCAAMNDVDALEDAIFDGGADCDDVNGVDGGKTALHYAVASRARDAVACLLDHGANPSIVDANGVAPADAATGRDAMIEAALDVATTERREMRRIADAVAAGRFHVDVGDLNAPPPPRAPLHAAIAEGKNAMVRFLMAMGASVVKGDGDAGGSPLGAAAEAGNHRAARLLLMKGAPPEGGGGDRRPPLLEALGGVRAHGSRGGHAKIAKALIDELKRLGRGAYAAEIIARSKK